MQQESDQKIQSLREELEEAQHACASLKMEISRQESTLVTKGQAEHELDQARSETKAVQIANEEYRKVLKTKHSEFA